MVEKLFLWVVFYTVNQSPKMPFFFSQSHDVVMNSAVFADVPLKGSGVSMACLFVHIFVWSICQLHDIFAVKDHDFFFF